MSHKPELEDDRSGFKKAGAADWLCFSVRVIRVTRKIAPVGEKQEIRNRNIDFLPIMLT